MKTKIYKILPGVLISFIVYFFSEILSIYFKTLGSPSIAILVGLIVGNLLFSNKKYEDGTKFCETKLLEYSIFLLGASLTFQTILELKLKGVIFILILMFLTIKFTYYICQKAGFSKKFSLLMGAGNAICGSSAIGASSKVLKSNSSETGIAITMVNVTGTILMFILPLVVVPLFFKGDIFLSSALIGGVLQSVGQVVGGAAMLNDDVVKLATIFKIFRIIMLTFVLLVFSRFSDDGLEDKKNKVKITVPWYIKGFFFMCVLASLNIIPDGVLFYTKKLSKSFEVIALAAIGLRVKYETIRSEGLKSLLIGLIIGLFQCVTAVTLIKILFS